MRGFCYYRERKVNTVTLNSISMMEYLDIGNDLGITKVKACDHIESEKTPLPEIKRWTLAIHTKLQIMQAVVSRKFARGSEHSLLRSSYLSCTVCVQPQ